MAGKGGGELVLLFISCVKYFATLHPYIVPEYRVFSIQPCIYTVVVRQGTMHLHIKYALVNDSTWSFDSSDSLR
jgi:hypothetical protein